MSLDNPLPDRVDRAWALDGATGKGVKVCVLDSGVEFGHPSVGELAGAVAISLDEDENAIADEDTEGDLCGHGTACAGVIRSIAPEAEIYSVRVLGAGFKGSGKVLLAGLRWAVAQDYDVINMSLSTTKRAFSELLRDIADAAYFKRTVLVASAHNMPVESYPWRFSSVISVGSHEEDDPLLFYANPDPPVEFFGRGVNVPVAWLGGSTITATGNSFATPAISAIASLVLSKHPRLTPFQLKSVLYLISSNVGGKQ
ncbi:MAG: S8 family serine peptidase [Gaiellaceae bacterium]